MRLIPIYFQFDFVLFFQFYCSNKYIFELFCLNYRNSLEFSRDSSTWTASIAIYKTTIVFPSNPQIKPRFEYFTTSFTINQMSFLLIERIDFLKWKRFYKMGFFVKSQLDCNIHRHFSPKVEPFEWWNWKAACVQN